MWRVAANHLLRFRQGRREAILSFEVLAHRLETGLRPDPPALREAEALLFAKEVPLRCTQAMLLNLDRESRIAYVLGDIFGLSSDKACARTPVRAHAGRCGVYDPANPCRCDRQVACAVERGLLVRGEAWLAEHPTASDAPLNAARAAEGGAGA